MTFIILITLGLLMFAFLITEAAHLETYGWFISKKDTEKFMNLKDDELELYRSDMLYMSKFNNYDIYICNSERTLLSKYYIQNFGAIPRWSKLHKKVDEYYRIARNRK